MRKPNMDILIKFKSSNPNNSKTVFCCDCKHNKRSVYKSEIDNSTWKYDGIKFYKVDQNKLQLILGERGLTQKELVSLINENYPDNPITTDTVNRFIKGSRLNTSLFTILRTCYTLDLTPNDILEY